MNTAQQIADAALIELEGEELLVEAMARAMCGVHDEDPDAPYPTEESQPYWKVFELKAKRYLVCDRVMRGPGDRTAYDRVVAQAKEREV